MTREEEVRAWLEKQGTTHEALLTRATSIGNEILDVLDRRCGRSEGGVVLASLGLVVGTVAAAVGLPQAIAAIEGIAELTIKAAQK